MKNWISLAVATAGVIMSIADMWRGKLDLLDMILITTMGGFVVLSALNITLTESRKR